MHHLMSERVLSVFLSFLTFETSFFVTTFLKLLLFLVKQLKPKIGFRVKT